ncbi:hypothetical protein J2X68_001880 [Streptomyces sp. 3330]|nr:hypothetical protein [Streptomyces sp. 3330]MDR6975196.1 hypothetical protein [Streptomyces sp. 3330]
MIGPQHAHAALDGLVTGDALGDRPAWSGRDAATASGTAARPAVE